MRTTVDIEDDVLRAAKELARQQQVSAGTVISRLLRIALSGASAGKIAELQGLIDEALAGGIAERTG